MVSRVTGPPAPLYFSHLLQSPLGYPGCSPDTKFSPFPLPPSDPSALEWTQGSQSNLLPSPFKTARYVPPSFRDFPTEELCPLPGRVNYTPTLAFAFLTPEASVLDGITSCLTFNGSAL